MLSFIVEWIRDWREAGAPEDYQQRNNERYR